MAPPPLPKRGMGCLPKLLIALGVVIVLLLSATVGSVYVLVQQNMKHLSDEPLDIPDKPMPPAEFEALRARFAALQTAQSKGTPHQIVLADREISALLTQSPELNALKRRVHVRFDKDRAYFYATVPMSAVPILSWFAGGKHLNVVVDLSPKISHDTLALDIQRLWLNNTKLPDEQVKPFSRGLDEGFAKRDTSSDHRVEEALRNLSDVAIRDGKLIIQTGGYGRITGQPAAATPP